MIWRALTGAIRAFLKRREPEQDLDDEIRFHVAEETQRRIALGESAEQARRSALRSIRSVGFVKDATRESWAWTNVERLLRDCRHAFRLAWRNRLFTAVGVALIALSIGFAGSVFSIVDALLLRPLPVRNADELVLVGGVGTTGRRIPIPTTLFYELSDTLGRNSASHLFGWVGLVLYGSVEERAGQLLVFGVTEEFYSAIDIQPLIGSLPDLNANDQGAVISYALWQSRFGGTTEILGQPLTLGETRVPVVAVTPPDFQGMRPDDGFDAILGLPAFNAARGVSPDRAGSLTLETMARLRPGVSREQFEAEVNLPWPGVLDATVPLGQTPSGWRVARGERLRVTPGSRGVAYSMDTRPGFNSGIVMTFGLAILTFAGACFTLALLTIARSARCARELSIQRALGGSPWRVLRPYLGEGLVVVTLGWCLGLFVAGLGTDLGMSFLPTPFTGSGWRTGVDVRVTGLATALALIAFAIMGLLTTLLSRRNIRLAIRDDNRISRPQVRLRTTFLTLQFAVSLVLAFFALAYVQQLSRLANTDVGFSVEDDIHIFWLSGRPPNVDLDDSYFRVLQEELSTFPGVEAVALGAGSPPLAFLADASAPIVSSAGVEANAVTVCGFPGYLSLIGLPRLDGRDFEWRDREAALVSEDLARMLDTDGNVLNQAVESVRSGDRYQIVGTTGQFAYHGPRRGFVPTLFVPCLGRFEPWPSDFVVNVYIRSSRSLASLRADVERQIDRVGVQYVYHATDLSDHLADSMQQERTLVAVGGTFGILSVLLTGIGLYAFCSAILSMKRKELGVRSALGASPAHLAGGVLQETLKVLGLGSTLGVLAILIGQRLLETLILSPDLPDESILIGSVLLLILTTLMGALVPTLQAARLDAAPALRSD